MKPQALANVVTGIAAFLLLLSASLLAAQSHDSAAISKLLTQVKNHAALANEDAVTLESFTRSGVHWSTHAAQLNQMRQHVNNLITDANQMSSLRDEGSPWQQEAIDRISPLLPVIASHLRATIDHLNQNHKQIRMQPYSDYVRANEKLINQAYQLIVHYESYAQAMARVNALDKEFQPAISSGKTMQP